MTFSSFASASRPETAENRRRVVIVGAGIVGLAHAIAASRRGHHVRVLERDAKPVGASVRNFGMIWPIGQPEGELHQLALRTRATWFMLAREAGLWLRPCGSIHLAHSEDEWAVLREFHAAAEDHGYECDLLGPRQVVLRTPAANTNGLIGGLFSPTEAAINPRTALGAIIRWLGERQGVDFEFSAYVREVGQNRVHTAAGVTIDADQIIVCGGDDCRALFPELMRNSGVRRCKLQMLGTSPQPDGWKIGPHLASGLTLRHYRSFAWCSALGPLIDRIARRTPELDRFGIHVMASQNDAGEVILGDSHEYDEEIEPFDKTVIDELILRELRRIIQLPSWQVSQRWHGIYLKHPFEPVLEGNPLGGVHISTATGGAGMTLSFGLAERFWEKLDSPGSSPATTGTEVAR